MKTTWLQRLHDLRCPRCDQIQPIVALSSTCKSAPWHYRFNDYAPCVQCDAGLRMVRAGPFGKAMFVSLFWGLVRAIVILVPFGLLASWMLSVLGLWGFLVIPLTFGLWGLIVNLAVLRLTRAQFRKVIVL